MITLSMILAFIALLIGIWLVCQHSQATRSAPFLAGIAIILLSVCHLIKWTPQVEFKI